MAERIPGIVRPTIDQTMAFFDALYRQLGIPPSTPFVAYSSGALLAWLEDPSNPPTPRRDTLEALRFGNGLDVNYGGPTFRNRLGELQLDEIPELYDVARKVNHAHGYPWTDPRTGVTYQPPEKK